MAIAFDSAVDGGHNGGLTNNHTFAFNNVAGNLLFVVFLGDQQNAPNDDITGVTYSGAALTLVDKLISADAIRYLYLYLKIAPATGTHDVVINCTNSHYLIAGAASYSGANTSGQPDAHTTHQSSSNVNTLTSSLVSVADNSWHLVASSGYDSATPNAAPGAGASTTRRTYDAIYGGWGIFDSNSAKTPAGSVSLTTTYVDADNYIGHVMASFAPLGAIIVQSHYRWRTDLGGLQAP